MNLVAARAMLLGAAWIEEPRWLVYAWVVTLGLAWAAAGTMLKLRGERRVAAVSRGHRF